MIHPQCSKKCYLAVLHHNTLNLLSNFNNAFHTFPKRFHDNALQLSQQSSTQWKFLQHSRSFFNTMEVSSTVLYHIPPPPLPPSLCSTVVFNAMNMLPQQFHITNNQSNKNVIPECYIAQCSSIFHSSLQCNELNLTQEVQHESFSLLSGVCHASSNRIDALPHINI